MVALVQVLRDVVVDECAMTVSDRSVDCIGLLAGRQLDLITLNVGMSYSSVIVGLVIG